MELLVGQITDTATVVTRAPDQVELTQAHKQMGHTTTMDTGIMAILMDTMDTAITGIITVNPRGIGAVAAGDSYHAITTTTITTIGTTITGIITTIGGIITTITTAGIITMATTMIAMMKTTTETIGTTKHSSFKKAAEFGSLFVVGIPLRLPIMFF
jgi:hypothetical protein